MNSKILNLNDAIFIAKKLHTQNIKLVIIGGCFDIIHKGHISFLKEAKKQGDRLMVLLESDGHIRKLKGGDRPINTQQNRALILASFTQIDYVVTLSHFKSDSQYDQMISELKPDIIATTVGDPGRHHKERQAELIGSKVVDVLDRIKNHSTSKIAQLLKKGL